MLTKERLDAIVIRVEEFDRTRDMLFEAAANHERYEVGTIKVRQYAHQEATNEVCDNARDDIKGLLNEVNDLRELLKALVRESRAFAHTSDSWGRYSCEYCGGESSKENDEITHYPDCVFSAAEKVLK
jgi:hypothetical protein